MYRVTSLILVVFLAFNYAVVQAQESEDVKVTFHIIPPANLPESATIYISGNFEGWTGGDAKKDIYKATRNADGNYSLTLTVPANSEIQYKFTLGSWASAEQNLDGSETQNRVSQPGDADLTITETIARFPRPVTDIASLEDQIKNIVEQRKIPGLQVAVMHKEGLIWRGVFGYRSLEQNLPVDEDTLFRIGSITKMFAAISALQLAEQGKLSLNDTLRQHANDIPITNAWQDTNPITLAHLLEHTSGWDDLHDSEYAYNDPARITTKEGLLFRPQTMTSRWVPGTRYSYSNKNTPAVAYALENVAGVTYEQYVQEQIFDVLGMDKTTFYYDDNYRQNGVINYALNEAQPYQHILDRAAGSVNSNIKDMEKLLLMFLNRGQYAGGSLITSDSLERMETPTTSLAAQQGISTGYGLANDVSFHKQLKVHGHGGAINGALASLQYFPELEKGYVFMMSSGNGYGAIRHTLNTFITLGYEAPEQSHAPSPYSMQLSSLEGYWVRNNPRREILRYIQDIASISRLNIEGSEIQFARVLNPGSVRRFTFSAENKARFERSGQEEFVVVTDPIDGQMIDMFGSTFKRISGSEVLMKFAFVGTWFVVSALALIILLAWIVKRLRKKTQWAKLDIRHKLPVLLPIIFAITYLSSFALAILDVENTLIGPVIVFIGTILYALLSCVGFLWALTFLKADNHRLLNSYAIIALSLHTVMTFYLASYGLIGIRLWV